MTTPDITEIGYASVFALRVMGRSKSPAARPSLAFDSQN